MSVFYRKIADLCQRQILSRYLEYLGFLSEAVLVWCPFKSSFQLSDQSWAPLSETEVKSSVKTHFPAHIENHSLGQICLHFLTFYAYMTLFWPCKILLDIFGL